MGTRRLRAEPLAEGSEQRQNAKKLQERWGLRIPRHQQRAHLAGQLVAIPTKEPDSISTPNLAQPQHAIVTPRSASVQQHQVMWSVKTSSNDRFSIILLLSNSRCQQLYRRARSKPMVLAVKQGFLHSQWIL